MLSDHFSLEEFFSSNKALALGINNTTDNPTILAALCRTATKLEKVRVLLGNLPIHIDSGYRCPELNIAVGSHPSSQHLKGEAVDFICQEYGSALQIARTIVANKDLVRYDQLILEHTWVHISFSSPTVVARGEVLSLLNGGKYAVGLTNLDGVAYA
jgi:hypothetical protein